MSIFTIDGWAKLTLTLEGAWAFGGRGGIVGRGAIAAATKGVGATASEGTSSASTRETSSSAREIGQVVVVASLALSG